MCTGRCTPSHSISSFLHGMKFKFVPRIPLGKWWRLMTSLTGSRDSCEIYRPEAKFQWHHQKCKITLSIIFCFVEKLWKAWLLEIVLKCQKTSDHVPKWVIYTCAEARDGCNDLYIYIHWNIRKPLVVSQINQAIDVLLKLIWLVSIC